MTYINKFKTVKILKKCETFFHGIDYLRINFDEYIPFFVKYFGKLDFDNSNFLFDEFLDTRITYQKVQLSVWPSIIWSVEFQWYPVPIFAYSLFQTIKTWWKKAKVDFYWSLFRLIHIWEIPHNFIDEFLKFYPIKWDELNISRIDYCIDFMWEKKLVNKRSDLIEEKHISNTMKKIRDCAEYTNRAVWSKKTKRVYIRFYDKLADSKSKNKFLLYADYFNYKSVERLEFEFGFKFTKWYTYNNLEQLENKITILLGIYQWIVGKIYPKEYKYDPKLWLNDYNKIPYVKQFCKRWEFLKNAWLDPFNILQDYLNATNTKDKKILQTNNIYSDVLMNNI